MSKAVDIDLERCATATQSRDCQPSPGHNTGRRCAIAVQHLDGRAALINTIIEEVGESLVFSSTKEQITRAVARSWRQRLEGSLLMGLVVGTARVKQVIHSDPQPCPSGNRAPPIPPPRLCLQDFTLDSLLTEALHNPQLLLRSESYPLNVTNIGSSSDDKSSSTSIYCDEQVLVVRRVIDRSKVAWLLILLLFLSPVFGIGVGICSHNADVGIAVSAGMFALATFVQGLVAWVQG